MNSAHDWHAARVVPLACCGTQSALLTQLDGIFFESSAVKAFDSEASRTAFRERWLGRFLRLYGDNAFLAVDGNGSAVGYVVGALEDPALLSLFEDIGYFKDFAHLTRDYPAHLHVNVASGWRSAGLGARLVDRFLAHAASRQVAGVHVVTSKGARNARFYARMGFMELGQLDSAGITLVFLGRRT